MCFFEARPVLQQFCYFLKMLLAVSNTQDCKQRRSKKILPRKPNIFGCLATERKWDSWFGAGRSSHVGSGGGWLFRSCFFPASPAGSGLCSWTSCLFVGIVDQTLGWPRLCWPPWPWGPQQAPRSFPLAHSSRHKELSQARLSCRCLSVLWGQPIHKLYLKKIIKWIKNYLSCFHFMVVLTFFCFWPRQGWRLFKQHRSRYTHFFPPLS